MIGGPGLTFFASSSDMMSQEGLGKVEVEIAMEQIFRLMDCPASFLGTWAASGNAAMVRGKNLTSGNLFVQEPQILQLLDAMKVRYLVGFHKKLCKYYSRDSVRYC